MNQPTFNTEAEKTYIVSGLFLQKLTLEQLVTIKMMGYSVEVKD